MDICKQRLIIDIAWAHKPGDTVPVWESELAQALNEAHNYVGTLWEMRVEPLDVLQPQPVGYKIGDKIYSPDDVEILLARR
jgi:hypothetical protein